MPARTVLVHGTADGKRPDQLFLMSSDTQLKDLERARLIADQLTKAYPTISMREEVLGGRPHLKGTRLAVGSVISAIIVHGSIDAAVSDYRNAYTAEQFQDALRYARDFLTESL